MRAAVSSYISYSAGGACALGAIGSSLNILLTAAIFEDQDSDPEAEKAFSGKNSGGNVKRVCANPEIVCAQCQRSDQSKRKSHDSQPPAEETISKVRSALCEPGARG